MGMDSGSGGCTKNVRQEDIFYPDDKKPKKSTNHDYPEVSILHPNFRPGVTGETMQLLDDPDNVHTLHAPKSTRRVRPTPITKTDDEINRQWEYNQITGRGSLPKGVE